MSVTIDVSGSGAVATGDTREHKDAFKGLGWKWSRSLGAWVIPRTWRHETVDYKVAQTVSVLADVATEVVGADDRDDDATREERRAERDRQLVDANRARADASRDRSDAAYGQSRQLADMIPMGQPVLVGHHSEGRHRRDLARIDRAMRRSVDESAAADVYESRARAAAGRVAARERAPKVAFGPGDVRKGDRVRTRYGWHDVVRVNAKSVSVPSLVGGSWTDRLAWSKVLEIDGGAE